MEPLSFFGGVDVGMKCQQGTFVVSSYDGTSFFFWWGECSNEMSTRDIWSFKLLWNLFLFLVG